MIRQREKWAWLRNVIGLAGAIAIITGAILAWVVVDVVRCEIGLDTDGGCWTSDYYLSPVLTAVAIWIVGVIIWRSEKRSAGAGFFWVIAGCLATGTLSASGNALAGRLFNLTLLLLGPLSIRFHQYLIDRLPSTLELTIYRFSRVLALVLSVPLLLYSIPQLQLFGLYAPLRLAVRLALVASLFVGFGLLVQAYRIHLPLGAARRLQILAFGSILAFSPLLLLSILPGTLGMSVFVPYELTFPFLLLSPLAYLYADNRRKFGKAERTLLVVVQRFSVAVISLAVFLVSFSIAGLAPRSANLLTLAGLFLVVATLVNHVYVEPPLAALARWSLQGRRLPQDLLDGIGERISLSQDVTELSRLLMHDLPHALEVHPPILVFLRQQNSVFPSSSALVDQSPSPASCLPLESPLLAHLIDVGRPVTVASILHRYSLDTGMSQEEEFLGRPGLSLVVPLLVGGVLQGVLGLGVKESGDAWHEDDVLALQGLGRQIAAQIYNLQLLDEQKSHRSELRRLHHELITLQDRSQRELAQELHDGAVQHLLSIAFQLARCDDTPDLERVRADVLEVAGQLRDMISQLRPSGLTDIGLAAALHGFVERLRHSTSAGVPRIRLYVSPPNPVLPSELALCLFRCAQEGFRNAVRHAHATVVVAELRVSGQVVSLTIEDDGCGFNVPVRLGQFAQLNHYGVVGMAERVEGLGGRLRVESEPGSGTRLVITLPLNEP